MSSDLDISALSHSELVTLVHHLRQQLAQQEQEIAQLKGQTFDSTAVSGSEHVSQNDDRPTNDDLSPGSREDLLAQLDKIYPKG